MRGNRVVRIPLEECVADSRQVNVALEAREFDRALELRGTSFNDALRTFNTLLKALPHPPRQGQRRLRLGILHAGAAAPGMNAAVRAAVRLATDDGHVALGVRRGFHGLVAAEPGRNGLDERERLGADGGSRARHVARRAGRARLLRHRPHDRAACRRRAAHHRRLGGVRGRVPPVRGAGQLPGLQHPDHLPARHHRQQPPRNGAEHRRRHRPQQHRVGRGQDQAGRRGRAALLRRRGDGTAVRLPRDDERSRDRSRARVPARGGGDPQGPRRRTSRCWCRASSRASGWA